MAVSVEATEVRAMNVGMVGNLFMGAAGILAAYLSHSQAILVDGLFSLIGFFAALMGRRVSRNASLAADKYRPYGYAGDEAIFTTFRSLSLLGLVLFAISGAVIKIVGYLNGEPQEELVFAPMLIYFVVVGAVCVILWLYHMRAWKKTGKTSGILHLESKAAAFDGIVTGAAAVGLLGIHLLRDGFLAPIAPIGDSLIVLVLCTTVMVQYWRDFMSGLAQLAGATASPEDIAAVRRTVREALASFGGQLVDLSVTKLGRKTNVVVYLDPKRPVEAAEVDTLAREIDSALLNLSIAPDVIVMISEHGRVLPDMEPSRE